MKKLKDIFKWKVDERQQLDLLKVEHYGFWFMYWALFISLWYQLIFLDSAWEQMAAEWIIFMLGSIFVVVGCMRKGVWSFSVRKTPGIKAYLLYSLAAAMLAGGLSGLNVGVKYATEAMDIVLSVGITAACTFALTFVVFLIVGSITKSREKKLAEMAEEDEDGED